MSCERKRFIVVGIIFLSATFIIAMLKIHESKKVSPYQNGDYFYFPTYYAEEEQGLWQFSTQTGQIEQVYSGKWTSFRIAGNHLFVLNTDGLYQMDPDGTNAKLIIPRKYKTEGETIYISSSAVIREDKEVLYLIAEAKNRWGTFAYDTEREKLTISLPFEDYVGFAPGQWIKNGKLISANESGLIVKNPKTGKQRIVKTQFSNIDSIGYPIYLAGNWFICSAKGTLNGERYRHGLFAIHATGKVRYIGTDLLDWRYLAKGTDGVLYARETANSSDIYLAETPVKKGNHILTLPQTPELVYFYDDCILYYLQDNPSARKGVGRYYLFDLNSKVTTEIRDAEYDYGLGLMNIIPPDYGKE